MTPAGLRSLFRYHRRTTGVKLSQPTPVPTLCNIPDYASSRRVNRFLRDFGPGS